MKFGTGYCPRCEKQVMIEKESCNHLFHFIMAALTSGIWVIVWIIVANWGEWRCCKCGHPVEKGTTAHDYRKYYIDN